MSRERTTRQATTKVIELMDEGVLNPRTVAIACMNYMSEADVADMAYCEDFIVEEDEEDEDNEE